MPRSQPPGYLAAPRAGNGRGVLVLHAWWGLNEGIQAVCSRLSNEGFVAFAPDLYRGKVATSIEEAETLSNALLKDQRQARADIAEAVAVLSARADVGGKGLGVIGFSLGGFFALDLSVADPERIRAVVVFYGTRPGADFSRSRAAYLGHFAEKDEFEAEADVDALEGSLRAAGRPVTFYRYPGTGHWFFEHDQPHAYDQQAAALAWERTLTFLRAALPS